MKNFVKC